VACVVGAAGVVEMAGVLPVGSSAGAGARAAAAEDGLRSGGAGLAALAPLIRVVIAVGMPEATASDRIGGLLT
jgi:hypothetical protein